MQTYEYNESPRGLAMGSDSSSYDTQSHSSPSTLSDGFTELIQYDDDESAASFVVEFDQSSPLSAGQLLSSGEYHNECVGVTSAASDFVCPVHVDLRMASAATATTDYLSPTEVSLIQCRRSTNFNTVYGQGPTTSRSGQLTSARSDPLFVNKRIMPALFREAEHAKFHSIDSQRTTIPTPNQQLAQHSLAYGNPRNSRLDTTVGSARLPPPSPALKCAVNCIRSPTYKEVNVIKCEIDGCTNVTGFTRESDLGRHKRSVHCEGPLYECPTAGCYHRTHRKDKMKSHRKNKHDGEDIGLYREKS